MSTCRCGSKYAPRKKHGWITDNGSGKLCTICMFPNGDLAREQRNWGTVHRGPHNE